MTTATLPTLTEQEFQQVLAKATAKFLKRVAKDTLYLTRVATPEFPNPTTWDINNGLCDAWAEYVEERVPGAVADWFEHNDNDHCVLYYNGRVYDAECLEGVEDARDLPIYQNGEKTRTQVLQERQVQ